MSDRYKKQRENRRKVFCTLQIPGMGWITGTSRKQPDCADLEKLPGRFYAPEEGIKVSSTYQYPEAVPIGNRELTVNCGIDAAPTFGDPVTIGASTYVTYFSWRAAGRLEQYQLKHLQELAPGTIDAYFAGDNVTVEGMKSLFKLSQEQATAMFNEYQSIVADLAEFAREQAVGLLECVWVNKEVEASCPTPLTLIISDQCLGDVYFDAVPSIVTIPAGVYVSEVSQEDANAQAEREAQSLLVCNFVNSDALTIECCDPDVDELIDGYTLALVSNTPSVVYPVGELVVVDAESASAAIDAARRFVLNCRCVVVDPDGTLGPIPIEEDFCSNIDIGDPDPDDPEVGNQPKTCSCPPDAEQSPPPPYNFTYTVPAGEFTGATQEAADADAELDCETSLNCLWCNDEVVGHCDEITIEATVVPAGTYCSEDSKEDANEKAQEAADGLSICGETCDGDCFCGTQTDAIERYAGMPKPSLPPSKVELVKDAISPCGMGSNVPWLCTPYAMAARIATAEKIGTPTALEAAEEMNRHCLVQIALKNLSRPPCGPNGAVCWNEPEPPEEEDDDGGGGGGGGDGKCDPNCNCLTERDARGQFFNPQKCTERPCGLENENDRIPIPKYCFRDNAQLIPNLPGIPDVPAPPSTPDSPEEEFYSCPGVTGGEEGEYCQCMKPNDVPEDMSICSGAPCGASNEVIMYCYRKYDVKDTDPSTPGTGDPTDEPSDTPTEPSDTPSETGGCTCSLDVGIGCDSYLDSNFIRYTANEEGVIEFNLPSYLAGDNIVFEYESSYCATITTKGFTGVIPVVTGMIDVGSSGSIPIMGEISVHKGIVTGFTTTGGGIFST